MREGWVLQERRREFCFTAQKKRIVGVGDLMGGELEGVDPDAMNGALVVLACVGAHQEPAGGDRHQLWDGILKRGLGERGHSYQS